MNKLWLPGNFRKTVPFGEKGNCRADGDLAQSWCSLPAGRCHALLICESPRLPTQGLAPISSATEGASLKERGWAARVVSSREEGSVAGGLVCVEAECRHAEKVIGSGCYPESNVASARIRTEEQCQCLPSRVEGSRSFTECHEEAMSSFCVPKGLSRTLLYNRRSPGARLLLEQAFSTERDPKNAQCHSLGEGGSWVPCGSRPQLSPPPQIRGFSCCFLGSPFPNLPLFNLLPMCILLFSFSL